MARSPRKKPSKVGNKVRVPFRRNRAARPRDKDWTEKARQADEHDLDTPRSESVVSKGALSRRRTIIVGGKSEKRNAFQTGVVIAMRGLFADVDDGSRVITCTVRRILRTRRIDERHPVVAGDRVRFSVDKPSEGVVRNGVIEEVQPRRGVLRRQSGRRLHTIVANVDQAVILSSAAQPRPKPHLIDRYVVAALFGDITPVICMNKIDLDHDGSAGRMLERYENLGYRTLRTSALSGEGVDDLCNVLRGKETGVAGQSGVGKSSLLNAVQPGWTLPVGTVAKQSEKGRHTTTTAELLKLDVGGYVIDTPGIRSFDLSPIPSGRLEAYFVEFVDLVARCKFPNCTHTHEVDCAIQNAVEAGEIHPDRYKSYRALYEEARE